MAFARMLCGGKPEKGAAVHAARIPRALPGSAGRNETLDMTTVSAGGPNRGESAEHVTAGIQGRVPSAVTK